MASDPPSPPKNFARTPTSWDTQDDVLLMHLKDTQKLGWKEIASHFHNRTPNACQFRWRRLKLGNLKNPPKIAVLPAASSPAPKKKRQKLESLPLGMPTATFTGYDTVLTALAGLSALANPAPAPPRINTTSHPQTFEEPKLDVPLDPQAHAAATAAGGYFTDISVDPTLNLPHNLPHHQPLITPRGTPRNSVDQVPLHLNLIIQIVRDDRTLILLLRLSVLLLPSKLMQIPHHQLTNSALAHLPVLFGSISGGLGSLLGPAGLQLALTLSSIRSNLIAPLRRPLIVMKPKEEKKEKEGPVFKIPWLMEEDELLINRRRKELSFAELSILLPQRTEGEIWARIDALERLRNGRSRERWRRQSLVGLDDVDDFYDEVDSVIAGIDSDDDVFEDAVPGRKKRRALSAVNPLSTREGIRRKL